MKIIIIEIRQTSLNNDITVHRGEKGLLFNFIITKANRSLTDKECDGYNTTDATRSKVTVVKTGRSICTFVLSSLENVTIPRTALGGRSRFVTLVVDPVSGVEIAETVAVAKAAAGKRMERNEIIFV